MINKVIKIKELKPWVYIVISVVIVLAGWFFLSRNNTSNVSIDLGNDLEITSIGSYSGEYVEDGSDINVNNVMMITVKNNGDKTLQYTEITLSGDEGIAHFSLSTLPPDETVTVLESSKKKFTSIGDYVNSNAYNVVFFNEEPSMHDDVVKIQELNGAFNVLNLTSEDINGIIYIYYKNISDDGYLGGITYRAKVEGLSSGELKQVMTNHFSTDGSEIMFVTIGQ